MRGDLEKIPGIKDITTDFTTNIATFKVATPQPELKATLDGFAKTNEHMKDWTFVEPKSGGSGSDSGSGSGDGADKPRSES